MATPSDSPAVHLLHVGKTGGTNVKETLRERDIKRTGDGRRIFRHGHKVTLAQVLSLHPDNEVFFFLRDPVTRFVSGFNSRLRKGAPAHDVPWTEVEERAFGYFPTPNDLAEALSSSDRETVDRAVFAINAIEHTGRHYAHWFHDLAYLRSRLDRVLFIGFQETYHEDVNRLMQLLGHDLEVPDVRRHEAPEGSPTDLSDLAVRNLREWYAADVEIYRWAQQERARFHQAHDGSSVAGVDEPDDKILTGRWTARRAFGRSRTSR